MRVKKTISVMLVFIMLISLLCGCGKKTEKEKMRELISDYSSKYTEISHDNRSYKIEIQAPDFATIIESHSADTSSSLSTSDLKKAIKEMPECSKVYTISVNSLDEAEIETAFINQVAFDLVVQAIQNTNYEEGAVETK